ncbi:RNA polymerase-associated protein RTF1-like protein [Sarcoptes scabiei]|nr:RNA polymerase-associated protein RTF1-like protein [Sarcoptes scabiei]
MSDTKSENCYHAVLMERSSSSRNILLDPSRLLKIIYRKKSQPHSSDGIRSVMLIVKNELQR